MADFSSFSIDPATGLPRQRKQPQLPYLDTKAGSQQNLPLAPQAQQPSVPQAAQTQLLGQAGAAAQAPSPTAGIQQQTQQMTQKMMADPNFGWNQDKYKGTAMSAFDLDRANATRTYKEQFGDIGGSGQVQEDLINTLLQGNIDRSKLENQIDTEGVERAKKNWMDAITAGQTEAKTASDLDTQRINNLLGVSQGYEGGLGREQQLKLAEINQQYQLALQANDLASAQQLQTERIKAESAERALDRGIDLMRVELEKRGVDFNQLQQTYENLLAGEEAGTVEAGGALKFLQQNTAGLAGLAVLDPNSEEALQASLEADVQAKRYQYMLSHPEYTITGADGKKTLSQAGLNAFDAIVNQTLYEEGGLDTAIGIQQKAAQALRDPAAYAQLEAIAKPWAGVQGKPTFEVFGQDNRVFANPPAKDSVFRGKGGILYLVTSDVALDETGMDDSEYFMVRNLKTGTTEKVWARNLPGGK